MSKVTWLGTQHMYQTARKTLIAKPGKWRCKLHSLCLFQRSLKKYQLRYTTVLSDGDSRTFHALTEQAVYDFKVEKKECVNHVHKRMEAALRALVDKKAQSEPLGGKRQLTQDIIKKIMNYYG